LLVVRGMWFDLNFVSYEDVFTIALRQRLAFFWRFRYLD
jgi:hypothetical protein